MVPPSRPPRPRRPRPLALELGCGRGDTARPRSRGLKPSNPHPASIQAVPGARLGSLSQRVIVSGLGSWGAVLWDQEAERESGEGAAPPWLQAPGEGDGWWGWVVPARIQGCLWGGVGEVLGCRGTAALSKARQAAVGQPLHLPPSKDPGLSKDKAAGHVGDWREEQRASRYPDMSRAPWAKKPLHVPCLRVPGGLGV